MGGFVPLPSPVNPYVSGSEQGAAAAAHAYNAAQTAKEQHARLKQQQATRDAAAAQTAFQNQLRLHSAGAIPAESQTRTGEGFIDRTQANPDIAAMGGGGQSVTDPGSGQKYYIPTEANKAQQKRQAEGFTLNPDTALGKALIGAGWDGKRPVTPAESHSLMMALNEAAPKDEPFDIDTSGKFLDAQGNPIPVMIGKKTGSVRQIDLSGAHAARQQADAEAQGGLPGGPFRTDTNDGTDGGDPFAAALLGPAEPTGGGYGLPEPSLAGAYGRMTGRDQAQTPAAPAQRAPKTAGGLSFKPTPKTPAKETPNDWIRIKTDPKSSPDEVKRATAAIAESRAGQTEADRDRHERETQAANDRAEREGERATDRADREAKENRRIETEKKKGIDAANKKYRTAMQTAFTPEAKKQALEELRSDLDETQGLYESATGSKEHSTWGATYDPEARSNDRGGVRPAPGRGGKPDRGGVRQLQ